MDVFESQVSREPQPAIGACLNLYYAGRTQLPPDETNGNARLLSDFEVAWYSG